MIGDSVDFIQHSVHFLSWTSQYFFKFRIWSPRYAQYILTFWKALNLNKQCYTLAKIYIYIYIFHMVCKTEIEQLKAVISDTSMKYNLKWTPNKSVLIFNEIKLSH